MSATRKITMISALLLTAATSSLYLGCRASQDKPPRPPGAAAAARVSTVRIATLIAPPTPPIQLQIDWMSDPQFTDQLQRSTSISGGWQNVDGGTSSPVLVTATQPFEFFRLIRNAR